MLKPLNFDISNYACKSVKCEFYAILRRNAQILCELKQQGYTIDELKSHVIMQLLQQKKWKVSYSDCFYDFDNYLSLVLNEN